MFKNGSGQKFIVFAFDSTTNKPKTGDAANITAFVSKDFAAPAALIDTSATEMDATKAPGYYLFDAAQAETNADVLLVSGTSTTTNIVVIGAPAAIFTFPTTGILAPATAGRTLVVDASGLADANAVKLGPTGAGTPLTARDIGLSVLLSAGAGTGQLDFAAGIVKSNLIQILGTTLTETAGQLAAGIKQFFNIGSPSSTMNLITAVTTTANLTTNNDKTGYGLSAAAVQAIWDELTSLTTTVGSIGKRLADFITGDAYARLGAPAGASTSADIAAVFSRLGAPAGASHAADVAAVKVDTAGITTTLGVAGAGLTALGDTRIANLDATVTSRATVTAIFANAFGASYNNKTLTDLCKGLLAFLAGKISGLDTGAPAIRSLADDKDVITTTGVDAFGNRPNAPTFTP